MMGDGSVGAVGGLRLGRWASLRDHAAFAVDRPAFSGVSGGRTSAMMHALLPNRVIPSFQNTGKEHPRTLDFLDELDAATGRRLVWLEFRKPRVKGAPPKDFEFAVVNYKTADRSGGPFEAFMEALTEYRLGVGKDPLAPWAMGRYCTAYMKNRVMGAWINSLGVDARDLFIGLRADEPKRVGKLLSKSTTGRTFRCGLSDVGIAKPDVMEFWRGQSFDLGLAERQGNCTGCFLKDESDLSRVLGEPETDAGWWMAMEDAYPDFGGRRRTSYRQLLAEREERLAIEAALRDRRVPKQSDASMTPYRFKLVVIQERKRLDGKIAPFSCSCEATQDLADMDEDDEDDAPRYGQLPLFG